MNNKQDLLKKLNIGVTPTIICYYNGQLVFGIEEVQPWQLKQHLSALIKLNSLNISGEKAVVQQVLKFRTEDLLPKKDKFVKS